MDRAPLNGQRTRVPVHTCMLYSSLHDFVAGVGEFVFDGLASGAAVLVALPPSRIDAIRRSFDNRIEDVEFVDMAAVGRNPGRILGVLHGFVTGHDDGPVRIVGEPIWPGRSSAETIEAIRHEALLNLAFAGTRVDVLCPYQVTALDADVLSAAGRTHSTVMQQGRYLPNPKFVDPVTVAAHCDRVTLPEPVDARTVLVTAATVGSLHARIADFATRGGASRGRAADLSTAVDETATLALGRGRVLVSVRLWRDHHDLIAEIIDPGPAHHADPGALTEGRPLRDPLAGRLSPVADAGPDERSLWRIHQLCDLVETRITERGRIHRLHLRTPA
jgi:hypothetical protein